MDPVTTSALATAFFQATSDVAQLIPKFGERRQKEIADLHDSIVDKKQALRDYALGFNENSYTDVLMGLAQEVKDAETRYQEKYIIYANEVKA